MIATEHAEVLKKLAKNPSAYLNQQAPECIDFLISEKLISYIGHPIPETCEQLTEDCFLYTDSSRWTNEYKITDPGKIALYEYQLKESEKHDRKVAIWCSVAGIITGGLLEYLLGAFRAIFSIVPR